MKSSSKRLQGAPRFSSVLNEKLSNMKNKVFHSLRSLLYILLLVLFGCRVILLNDLSFLAYLYWPKKEQCQRRNFVLLAESTR